MRIRAFISALLLAAIAAPVGAEENCRGPEGLVRPLRAAAPEEGSFHWVDGKGLGCVIREEDALGMARNDRPLSYLACLKIGAVAISDDLDDVEERLGRPDRNMPLSETTEARAYFIPQRSPVRPYYVVTYRRQKVVAVQLIGVPTQMPFTFSGIALGDRPDAVLERLGPPVKRCPGPRGSETWLWPPFPIGVDFRDGRVSAMKVTWPAD